MINKRRDKYTKYFDFHNGKMYGIRILPNFVGQVNVIKLHAGSFGGSSCKLIFYHLNNWGISVIENDSDNQHRSPEMRPLSLLHGET